MNGSSRFECIDGFGEELDEIIYGGLSNWFISFRSAFTVYAAHFSYLVVFFAIISCGILSYRHSVENGLKYTQFWYGALIHGVISERGLTATKYWHAQAPIMFMGKQLPLHLVFLYPSILYLAMMASQRLNLNVCTEPAAVGLIAMLMEIPYRMISVKFLHITYHDTEPMYYNKLCGVPWVEIFSSLVMASSYVAVYHGGQYYQSRDISTIWDKSSPSRKETITTVLCGIISPLVGFLQKVLLLHVLNDFFNVNPVSCLFLVVSMYVSYVVCFEPKRIQKCVVEDSCCKTFLFYQVFIYLTCFIYLALFGRPQNEVSIGTHEPTGDCTMLICSRTPLGKETQRRMFLCIRDLCHRSHFLYNFDCVPNGAPSLNSIWYSICVMFVSSVISFTITSTAGIRNKSEFPLHFSNKRADPGLVRSTIFQCKLNLTKKIFQQPMKRKKYLCTDEVAARKNFVYNFDCLEEGPPCLHAIWYTICGSPIYNRAQFFLNVLSFVILLCTIFSKTLFSVTTQLDSAKRLILRLRSELRRLRPREAQPAAQQEEQSQPIAEEVTVGFVLIKNDIHVFAKDGEHFKVKTN